MMKKSDDFGNVSKGLDSMENAFINPLLIKNMGLDAFEYSQEIVTFDIRSHTESLSKFLN